MYLRHMPQQLRDATSSVGAHLTDDISIVIVRNHMVCEILLPVSAKTLLATLVTFQKSWSCTLARQ